MVSNLEKTTFRTAANTWVMAVYLTDEAVRQPSQESFEGVLDLGLAELRQEILEKRRELLS